ncbi:MAG: leucine-rich repeat domain-containing protein [Bacteroidetes bacterium]|nr:MAG: leucine-rich repeat domain-containing protein [Bacteroidota bacterium]
MQTPEENSLLPVPQYKGTMTVLQQLDYMTALVNNIMNTPLPTNWQAWFESLDAEWQKLIALHVDLMDRGMEYKEFTENLRENPYTQYQEKIGKAFVYAPFDFTKIENLTYLYLCKSNLSHLPAEIGQLKNLTDLDLQNNQLSHLPTEIGQLGNLIKLFLHCNQLSHLPAEIGQLENLRYLYLGGNQFSEQEKIRIRKLLPNCNVDFEELPF